MSYFDDKFGLVRDVKLNDKHDCVICKFTQTQKAQIKIMYMEWFNDERICECIGLEVKTNKKGQTIIVEHARAYAWDVQRSKNPYLFHAALLREHGPMILEAVHNASAKAIVAVTKALETFNKQNTPKDIVREQKTIAKILQDQYDQLPEMGLDSNVIVEVKKLSMKILEKQHPGISTIIESDMKS